MAPKCALLIRIKVLETNGATFQFGTKFGVLPDEMTSLLQASQAANLRVVRVSFHIGSRAINFNTFEDAIIAVKTTFETAAELGMPEMHVLDIGGGFASGPKYNEAAAAAKVALQKNFHNHARLTVMAEPGLYFANEPFTLATNIIVKRVRGEIKELDQRRGLWVHELLKYDHDDVICTTLMANYGRTKNTDYTTCKGLLGLMIRQSMDQHVIHMQLNQ